MRADQSPQQTTNYNKKKDRSISPYQRWKMMPRQINENKPPPSSMHLKISQQKQLADQNGGRNQNNLRILQQFK